MKSDESERVTPRDLFILLFPTRYKIYKALKDSEIPLYASKIAKKIGVERKLVSFHLMSLEKNGFVTGKYGLQNKPVKPPRAVRYYHLTGKAQKVLEKLSADFSA